MEVIINGSSHQWESNFLTEVRQTSQSKWFKKREDYFAFDTIGGTKCFIKRSETGFDGVSIFKNLVGQPATAIPKTYGFGEVIENNQKVQYLITEFLEGHTLDVHLNNGKTVDLIRFAERLGDLKATGWYLSLGVAYEALQKPAAEFSVVTSELDPAIGEAADKVYKIRFARSGIVVPPSSEPLYFGQIEGSPDVFFIDHETFRNLIRPVTTSRALN